MLCKNCGKKLLDDEILCSSCGVQTESKEMIWINKPAPTPPLVDYHIEKNNSKTPIPPIKKGKKARNDRQVRFRTDKFIQ